MSALRRPAYAREISEARERGDSINLHAHVGRRAWARADHRPGKHRLALTLDHETGPADYDLTGCAALDVLLNAIDADLVLARQVAVRFCEHGARVVVLLHPALPQFVEFFYSAVAK